MNTMNIYIATFVKEKAIYIDENQVNNKNYPLPFRLAGLLEKCGYYLGSDLEGWISPEYEKKILNGLEEYLVETHGIDKNWKTVYQNPEDLPDEVTQKIHQSLIYANPDNINEINKNPGITNNYYSLSPLKKGEKADIIKTISELLCNPIPLGNLDNVILSWGIEELDLVWPEKITCKEILCMALSKGKGLSCISSVNDILRTATFLSPYKDTTLSKHYSIKLNGAERRLIIKLLEDYLTEKTMKYRIQEAKKYKEKWSILSRILHVKPSNKLVWNFFNHIYNGNFGKGWGSKIQEEYDKAGKTGSLVEVIKLFSQRPGEFIRHYDSLLRRSWENKDSDGMNNLQDVLLSIQNIRPKILFDLYKYYEGRNQEIPRSYKNKVGVRITYGDPLKPLDDDLIKLSQNMIYRGIKELWGKEKTLEGKKIYFDIPEDSELITSCRTSGDDTVFPGEKIYFEPKGEIKFFTQWIDLNGDQDLDIHALLMDEHGELKRLSWNSYYGSKDLGITHSGDVRNVKGDCEEYVCVRFKHNSYKWMLIGVQNYNSPRLCDLENYIGLRRENDVIYRAKVNLNDRNLIGFLVNLEEGYVKFIMEGTNEDILTSFGKTKINQYILQKNLNLKNLLKDYIEAKGGIVMDTPDEETEILPRNAWELSKLLLE